MTFCFLDSRCHLHTNPVLVECTMGGEMYKTNIFVKCVSCLVILQYLQCEK